MRVAPSHTPSARARGFAESENRPLPRYALGTPDDPGAPAPRGGAGAAGAAAAAPPSLLDRVLLRRGAEPEPPPPTADETLAAATSAKVYRRGAWETRLLRTPFEYRPLTDDAMSFSTLAG